MSALTLKPGLIEPLGIHQSDVVIRTAIIEALADMRRNPWLLDYVFSSLSYDALTKNAYGEREVAAAKKWFADTEIPVFMNTRIGDAKLPCISITLVDSTEAENTLSDTHYVVHEDSTADWPVKFGPFTPESYEATTGTMVLGSAVTDYLDVTAGMFVIDRTGRAHEVIEVIDDLILLAENTVADFAGALLKDPRPSITVALESLAFKETYSIGCHAMGEPIYLTYLHSIMMFALLRYKETLLEARGFERMIVSSSDIRQNEQLGVEQAYSRWIQVSGAIRHYWPKVPVAKITGTGGSQIQITGGEHLPEGTDPDESLWIGDEDALTFQG